MYFLLTTNQRLKALAVCLVAMVAFLISTSAVFAKGLLHEPLHIQSLSYDPQSQTLGFYSADGGDYPRTFQPVRLTNPDRVSIDIPNAVLDTPVRVLNVRRDGIERVDLSETRGIFYHLVRITVTASSVDTLNRLRIESKNNALYMAFQSAPPINMMAIGSHLPVPLPAMPARNNSSNTAPSPSNNTYTPNPLQNILSSQTTVTAAGIENGVLKVNANGSLSVKNQFTLSSPSRLVVDLEHAVLADKALTTPMDVNQGNIETVRLGQFDEDTVRIVIQTNKPNSLFISFPQTDRQQLVVSARMNNLANSASSNGSLSLASNEIDRGEIQSINVTRRDSASIVQIMTTRSMIRRVVRHGNQVEVDLMNMDARPGVVTYDKQSFPEVAEINVVPPNEADKRTRLLIQLDDSNLNMESRMSNDGLLLEVALIPDDLGQPTSRGIRWPDLIMPEAQAETNSDVAQNVPKGKYTVVVDAGHGGKDMGANRAGVLEKNLNLSVALKLRDILESKGVTVKMTRTTDTFVPLPGITAFSNSNHPDAFVSVHTNASLNAATDGIETYYYTSQSIPLAKAVHRRLTNNISAPDRSVRKAMFYVIHHTSIPAILCEMGYISNAAEREELQTESRQQATAESIAEGVIEFLLSR